MEAGAKVWCTDNDGDEAWLLAEVLKKKDNELELQLVDKPEKKFTRPIAVNDSDSGERKYEGVELANTPLSEAEQKEGRDDDLITLPHLHEPAILHAITERFFRGKIYTWTGPVIIAVNPFQRLPLYTTVSREKFALYVLQSVVCSD
jgi:myosin heavy subunit